MSHLIESLLNDGIQCSVNRSESLDRSLLNDGIKCSVNKINFVKMLIISKEGQSISQNGHHIYNNEDPINEMR